MKLSVVDRILLLNNIPPQTGDITCIRIVRKLREDLSFSDEDYKLPLELKLDKKTQNYKWNTQADPMKDVEIGDKAMEIVVDAVKMFTKVFQERDALPEQFMITIEKFLSNDELDKIIEEVKTEKAEAEKKAKEETKAEDKKKIKDK